MVREKNSEEKGYYNCEVCGMAYEDKEWADKCEAWCSAHEGSCNLDIIQHAADITDKGCC